MTPTLTPVCHLVSPQSRFWWSKKQRREMRPKPAIVAHDALEDALTLVNIVFPYWQDLMIRYKLHIRNTFRTCFCIVTFANYILRTNLLQILPDTVSCLAPHRTPSTETVRNNNEHGNKFGAPQYAEWRCCSWEVAISPICCPKLPPWFLPIHHLLLSCCCSWPRLRIGCFMWPSYLTVVSYPSLQRMASVFHHPPTMRTRAGG